MTETATGRSGFVKQFPFAFWLINGIELLERGAYYGMLAVLPVYLIVRQGMPEEQAGVLFAILLPLLYFVPILASPFAEKFGYRASLAVCFVILGAGYALLPVMGDFYGYLLCVTLIGVGGGIFKPIAAAVIGQTTTEAQRNFGYQVYYWAINVGSIGTNLLIGLFLPREYIVWAFYISAILIAANLVITLTVYRNVLPPQRDRNVWQAIKGLGAIAKEPAYVVLLLIYAGFWFMYGIALTYLSVYMVQFGVMPEWFNESLLNAINPGTIVVVGLVLAKVTEKVPSLLLMTIGIAGFVVGFVVLGFTAIPALFIAGVVMYSAFEFLIQPSFLAYVSKFAPQDKLSIYISYGFVPIGVGFLASGLVGGQLYATYARDQGQPEMFWAIIGAVGLVTVAALVVYDLMLTRSRAPAGERRRSPWAPAAVALVALLSIPALLGAATVATTDALEEQSVDGPLALVTLPAIAGTTQEGEAATETVDMPSAAVRNATFTLRWTDEAGTALAPNAPDTFILKVTPPGAARPLESAPTANAMGEEGVITLVVAELPEGLEGAWTVVVELTTAGDPSAGPLAPPTLADGGNAWELEVAYEGPSEPAP